ncbi:B2 protein-like isoform X1 [Lycium barbarum]|uniref:B2 protein-like isoform X1 n=2 Tax=Lycium barbarum TaxID=112863 RepID=UPI00293EEC9C|nr:B2 protein-like isoform X1 [Lycium barbarum]
MGATQVAYIWKKLVTATPLSHLPEFRNSADKGSSMDSLHSYWQFGDELRGQSKVSEDHKWSTAAMKLAEQIRSKGERRNNLDFSKGSAEIRPRENIGFQEDNKWESLNLYMLNLDNKMNENTMSKSSMASGMYNMNSNVNSLGNVSLSKLNIGNHTKESNNNNSESTNGNNAADKRFKTLPAAETLPRNEVLGGYIFVCNNDTMQEDLKRQLFGLPPRYRDSVRAITPGLPLFLYNYTTHQLHGIFEAASFGGSNIDPTAWEDKKCKGESRFPAQVRTRVRQICKPLEEDAFRPVLHHYDGPKFRLELSIPETLDLLDLCEKAGV